MSFAAQFQFGFFSRTIGYRLNQRRRQSDSCCCNFDSLEPQTQLMKRKSSARRPGQNLKLKTSFRFLKRKSTTFSQSNFSERTPSECARCGGSLPSPSLRLAQVAMASVEFSGDGTVFSGCVDVKVPGQVTTKDFLADIITMAHPEHLCRRPFSSLVCDGAERHLRDGPCFFLFRGCVQDDTCGVLRQEVAALREESEKLRAQVARHLDAVVECCACNVSSKAPVTMQTVPQNPYWEVTSGDYQKQGDCVTSPNYPDNYDDDQQCTITILSHWTRYLDVVDFQLELGFDLLNVNGDRYIGRPFGCGARSPRVEPTGVKHFPSTYSRNEVGFKLCRSNVSVTHAPTTLQISVGNHSSKYWSVSEEFCHVDVDECIQSPAFPSICPSEYSCTIELPDFWEVASLNVVCFDTESMMHCISTTSVFQATRTSQDCRVLSPPPPFAGRQITASPRRDGASVGTLATRRVGTRGASGIALLHELGMFPTVF